MSRYTCALPSQWDWDVRSDKLPLELLAESVPYAGHRLQGDGRVRRNERERRLDHRALEQALNPRGTTHQEPGNALPHHPADEATSEGER